MKTKLLTILLCLFPVMLFAQNYEKEGDMCFEKGEYQEAEKKYKAAALLSGESSVLSQKQKNSSTCFELLTKVQEAEQDGMYSNAANLYEKLYSIHSLSKYQEKAEAYRQKVAQLQKEKEKATDLPDLDLFGRPVEFSDPGQTKKEPKITVYSPDFLAFWQRYPRKTGKGAAFRSWKIHRPPLNACLKAIAWQEKTDQWTRDGGQYIPHPSTWINQERWLDEPKDTERQ